MTESLRGRLLLGLVALAVVGLVTADIATYSALQSFLLQRLDSQLQDSSGPMQSFLARASSGDLRATAPGPRPGAESAFGEQPGAYAALFSPGGTAVYQAYFVTRSTSPSALPRPQLPRALPVAGFDQPLLFDAPGTNGVARYRVLSQRLDQGLVYGDVMVIALPLTDVQSTLDRLLLIEAVITGLVLLGIGVLAWWIIRIGLRPLERMGADAAAIAAGELSRRVEPATERTEIGRLGLALNAMLAQIESAFAERTESESRLRRFVADASHELRTPLTSIRGYSELLRRQPPPPPADARLAQRRIEEESVRMSALVNDMLLLARLDQGRPLEKAPVDLARVARDAAADARVMAPEREVEVSAPDRLVVLGDDLRLRQVVSNLVRNALVHTPAGTPVAIAARAGEGVAVLSVEDHGPGLEPGQAARVFEPFYRADASRSRDRGGAGLGLAIAAAVVSAHEGRIEVVATDGGGATFRVELPLAAPAGQPGQDPAGTAATEPGAVEEANSSAAAQAEERGGRRSAV